MTLTISIPDNHYAGFQIRKDDIYPLGFIVPDGTDRAAKDRKSTVDRWAAKSKVQIPSKTFINQPMVGFKIRKSIKHQFSSSNVERWRIVDPRGFELEISNINMSMIIDNCLIDNGEIIDSCVWARDGKDNILLPTSTDEYKTATQNTQRKKSSVSLSQLKLGDHIILNNGTHARYLGKYYKALEDLQYPAQTQPTIFLYSKTKQFVLQIGEAVQSYSNIKISEIVKNDFITPNLAEETINKLVASGKCTNYYDTPKFFVSSMIPIEKFKMTLTEFSTYEEARNSKFRSFIVKRPSGQHLLANHYNLEYLILNNSIYNNPNLYVIDFEKFSKGEINFELFGATIYGMCQEGTPKFVNSRETTGENLEFFGIEFDTITELGNSLSIKI